MRCRAALVQSAGSALLCTALLCSALLCVQPASRSAPPRPARMRCDAASTNTWSHLALSVSRVRVASLAVPVEFRHSALPRAPCRRHRVNRTGLPRRSNMATTTALLQAPDQSQPFLGDCRVLLIGVRRFDLFATVRLDGKILKITSAPRAHQDQDQRRVLFGVGGLGPGRGPGPG